MIYTVEQWARHGAHDGIAYVVECTDYVNLFDSREFVKHRETGACYHVADGAIYELPSELSRMPLNNNALAGYLLSHAPTVNKALLHCIDKHYPALFPLLQAFTQAEGREGLNMQDVAEARALGAGIYIDINAVASWAGYEWLAEELDSADLEGVYLAGFGLSKWRIYSQLGLSREAIREFKRITKKLKL